jgi:hypothetical protein
MYMIIPLDLIIHYVVGFPYAMKYLVQGAYLATDPQYGLPTVHTRYLSCHFPTQQAAVIWDESHIAGWRLLVHLQSHLNNLLYPSDTEDPEFSWHSGHANIFLFTSQNKFHITKMLIPCALVVWDWALWLISHSFPQLLWPQSWDLNCDF